MAISGAQTLTFKSVTKKQTNKQTNKLDTASIGRAAAKPAACAKPLMLSTVGSQGGRREGEAEKEVGRDEVMESGRRKGGRE